MEENKNLDLIKEILGSRLNEEAIVHLAFNLASNPNFINDLIVLLSAYQLGVKFRTAKQNYMKDVLNFDEKSFDA